MANFYSTVNNSNTMKEVSSAFSSTSQIPKLPLVPIKLYVDLYKILHSLQKLSSKNCLKYQTVMMSIHYTYFEISQCS